MSAHERKEYLTAFANLVGLFKCRSAQAQPGPEPKTFSKNIPRRIFKDRRDAEGVVFSRDPLYLLGC